MRRQHVVLDVDEHCLEPGLVVAAPGRLVGRLVGKPGCRQQPEDGRQDDLLVGVLPGQALTGGLGCQQLVAELTLLLGRDIRRYRSLHRHVGPLVALASNTVDLSLDALSLLRYDVLLRGQGLERDRAQLVYDLTWPDLDEPLLRNRVGDPGDGQVRQLAAVPLGVPPGAEEVLVLLAALATGDAVEQAALAAAAEQRARQVVLVPVRPLPRLSPRGQELLNPLKRLGVDERGVLPGVLDAAPGDQAEVVAVAQHFMQLVRRKNARCALWGRPLRQSTLLQCRCQVGQAPVTGGVRLEGPAHVFRPLGVEFDGTHLAPINNTVNIAVAEWCNMRSAARANLLLGALEHLGGQVAAVELGNRAHDAVEQ